MSMKHQRAYRSRCYPTPSQRQLLARTFGCARFVYTDVLRCQEEAPKGKAMAPLP